jgi:hypothetical protein
MVPKGAWSNSRGWGRRVEWTPARNQMVVPSAKNSWVMFTRRLYLSICLGFYVVQGKTKSFTSAGTTRSERAENEVLRTGYLHGIRIFFPGSNTLSKTRWTCKIWFCLPIVSLPTKSYQNIYTCLLRTPCKLECFFLSGVQDEPVFDWPLIFWREKRLVSVIQVELAFVLGIKNRVSRPNSQWFFTRFGLRAQERLCKYQSREHYMSVLKLGKSVMDPANFL